MYEELDTQYVKNLTTSVRVSLKKINWADQSTYLNKSICTHRAKCISLSLTAPTHPLL